MRVISWELSQLERFMSEHKINSHKEGQALGQAYIIPILGSKKTSNKDKLMNDRCESPERELERSTRRRRVLFDGQVLGLQTTDVDQIKLTSSIAPTSQEPPSSMHPLLRRQTSYQHRLRV